MITKDMVIAIVGVVLAVGFYIVFMTQENPSNTEIPSNGGEGNRNISIENFSFKPATLTIKTGETVVWTNKDSAQHDIKSAGFNSALLSKGQTFEFKFNEKGSYDYSCGVHPSMLGKIIVE